MHFPRPLMSCHTYLLVSLQSLQLHVDKTVLDGIAADINERRRAREEDAGKLGVIAAAECVCRR